MERKRLEEANDEPVRRKPQEAQRASNDVDLAYYEDALRIEKDALDDEFVRQPQMLQEVCSRYALAVSLRDAAKDAVKQVEAELAVSMRERAPEGKRPTDKSIEAQVDSHPRRQKAFDTYVESIREALEWEGMFESWKQRGYVLSELTKLFLAGYWSKASSDSSASQSRYREAEIAKDRVREARRNRE